MPIVSDSYLLTLAQRILFHNQAHDGNQVRSAGKYRLFSQVLQEYWLALLPIHHPIVMKISHSPYQYFSKFFCGYMGFQILGHLRLLTVESLQCNGIKRTKISSCTMPIDLSKKGLKTFKWCMIGFLFQSLAEEWDDKSNHQFPIVMKIILSSNNIWSLHPSLKTTYAWLHWRYISTPNWCSNGLVYVWNP